MNHWAAMTTDHPANQPDGKIADDAALAADAQDEQGALVQNIDAIIELADEDITYKDMADAFLSGPEHFHALFAKAIKPHHLNMAKMFCG